MKDGGPPQATGRARGAFPLSRRAFLGAAAGSLAATALRASEADLEDVDLAFDFSDDSRKLTISIVEGNLRGLREALSVPNLKNADRFLAHDAFRKSFRLDDATWALDARKFGPEARFEVLVLGTEDAPRYRLDVVRIRYGREARRTLQISLRRIAAADGKLRWALNGVGNVWSGSQSGAFFRLGADTDGAFLDLRAFLGGERLVQRVRRSRAQGFLRRVSNTLISPIGDDTLLGLHSNGDWTYGDPDRPQVPVVRMFSDGTAFGPLRVGWCLGADEASDDADPDPLCRVLGDAAGQGVVAFADATAPIRVRYGGARSITLQSLAPEADRPPARAVLLVPDRDGVSLGGRLPLVAEIRVEAGWSASATIGGVTTGTFRHLHGVLARRSAIPSAEANSDPTAFDNAVEFGADFAPRSVNRLSTSVGDLVTLGPEAREEDAGSARPLFRNLSGSQFRCAAWSRTSGTSSLPTLEWMEANLELVEAAFALPDAHYSRLIFDPTEFRVLFGRADVPEMDSISTETGQYQGSFLDLDDPGPDGLRAYFGLSRARLYAARADDLACMTFRFRGLGLAITDTSHEVVLESATCGVTAQPDLATGAVGKTGTPADTRPLLVVEFPPQHVMEEACFVPAAPPLPDLTPNPAATERRFIRRSAAGGLTAETLPTATASDFGETWLIDPFDRSALSVALSRLSTVSERERFRRLVKKIKLGDTADHKGYFEDVARRLAAFPHPALFPPPVRLFPRTLPDDQRVYIGPVATDPDAAFALRRIQSALQDNMIRALVTRMFRDVKTQAGRLVAAGDPDIAGFEHDFSAALALEGRLESAVPAYQLFRSFYRDETLDALQSGSLKSSFLAPDPENIEFVIALTCQDIGCEPDSGAIVTRKWVEDSSTHPLQPTWEAKVTNAFRAFLAQNRRPTGLAHARHSAPSRLAFRVNCRDRVAAARARANHVPHLVDALETLPEENLGIGVLKMDFTLRALTDWSSMELSVVKRAANVYVPGSGGRLDSRSGRRIDVSATARLRHLGYTQADPGGAVNSETRLSDIETAMREPPGAYETAIEIPARLQLSPSDSAVFLNRRGVLRAIFSESPVKVTEITERDFLEAGDTRRIFTARLHTNGQDPGLRAIHSQDFRPDFVWGGARARQGRALTENTRLPGGSAPPGGNFAPWLIGPEEGAGRTPDARRLLKAIKARNPSDFKEWGDGTEFGRAEDLLGEMYEDERAFCAELLRQKETRPYVVPGLIERLCRRSPFLRGWSPTGDGFDPDDTNHLFSHLRHFRSGLSANDRHQLVVLTSAFGLPVTGRLDARRRITANSGQVEATDGFALDDLLPGSAIYRPPTLQVKELSLSALGGTLRLDTSFEPPVSARRLDGTDLFDALSIEKWQQWTVLGRDVFTEIVYKGFLFPLGHRASLVKVTERTYYRDASEYGIVRAYLRQRLFIRCGKPVKQFPAVGQANAGRGMPADQVTVLTVQTPDIVDPYFGQNDEVPGDKAALQASGRVSLGAHPGLAFFPRTALIQGAEVRFELDVAGNFTDLPLIFVDNTAANNRPAMKLLETFYNEDIPTPDAGDEPSRIDPVVHMRTLRFNGNKMRYAPEIASGSASIETEAWTLAVEGREDLTVPAVLNDGGVSPVRKFALNNTSYAFTPLLQGVDQPPFYPVIDTARIRLRQNERLTGVNAGPVRMRFDGHYLANGLPLAIPEAEAGSGEDQVAADIENASRAIGNGMQVYLVSLDPQDQSMGAKGDNSGGVFRPSGTIVALSRSKGTVTYDPGGSDDLTIPAPRETAIVGHPIVSEARYLVQPSLAAYFNALPARGKPQVGTVTRADADAAQDPPGQERDAAAQIEDEIRKLREFLQKIFASDAKILGLVSVKDLMGLLTELAEDGSNGAPELLEQVHYGAGKLADAADDATDFLRDSVLRPIDRALTDIRDTWSDIDGRLRELQALPQQIAQPVTLQELFPELFSGLQSLQASVQKSLEIENDIEFALSLSEVYEAGRRFLNAVQATAANPVERFENAFVSRVNVIQSLAVDFEKSLPDLARRLGEGLKRDLEEKLSVFVVPEAAPQGVAGLFAGNPDDAPFKAFPILLPSPAVPDPVDQEALDRIYDKAFPSRKFVRAVVRKFAEIVIRRLAEGQSLDLDAILTSTEGSRLVTRIQTELDDRLRDVQNDVLALLDAATEDARRDAIRAYAEAVAGLRAMIELESGRFEKTLLAHLTRELEPLLRAVRKIEKLKRAIETTPDRLDIVLKRSVTVVEVFTGDLGIDVRAVCQPEPIVAALNRVAAAVDPETLAFYGIIVKEFAGGRVGIAACEGFDDTHLQVVAPGQTLAIDPAPSPLHERLRAWHDRIASTAEILEEDKVTGLFDAIEDNTIFQDAVDQDPDVAATFGTIKAQTDEAARVLRAATGVLRNTVKELHCGLVDDAVRLKALGDVFRQALAQLGDLCSDPTSVLQSFGKQSAAFLEGRAEMLRRTMDNLGSVIVALDEVFTNASVQRIAAAGGVIGLLGALVGRVADADDRELFRQFIRSQARDAEDAVNGFAVDALVALWEISRRLQRLGAELNDGIVGLKSDFDAVLADPVLARLVDVDQSVFEALAAESGRLNAFLTALEKKLGEDVAAATADPTKALGLLEAHARTEAPDLNPQMPYFRVYFRPLPAPAPGTIGPGLLADIESDLRKKVIDPYSRAIEAAFGVLTEELLAQLDGLVVRTLGASDPGGLWTQLRTAAPSELGQDPAFQEARFGVIWALYRWLQYLRDAVLTDGIASELLAPVLLVDKRDGTPADPDTRDDRLAEDVRRLQAIFDAADRPPAPVSDPAAKAFLATFLAEWRDANSAPLLILRGVRDVFADLIRGNIVEQFPFDRIRDQIESELRALVPSRVEMKYGFGTKLNPAMKSATAGIFEPKRGTRLRIDSRISIDISSGKPDVTFRAEGTLGKFDINLVGSFDAIKLMFNGARFISENGAEPTFLVDYADYRIGKELEFVQQLQSYFTPKDGSGFYLEPLFSPIGIEAGYDLPLGTISIGTASFFNVSISAAARLPFEDAEARFRGSLSRRNSPFTVSIAPYGGSGFFAIEANTRGIVGFEASFEFGGAGAFAFGPLNGQGRIMAGVYVRQIQVPGSGKLTEISGTFFAGGSANIWIFSFGASLYVRLGMVNGDMSGEAVFTYSFSVGIKDFEFSVEVWRKEGKGFQSSQQASLPPSGTRLARHMRRGATLARLAGSDDPDPATVTVETPQVQVDVAHKSDNWTEYRKYFDRDLVPETPF